MKNQKTKSKPRRAEQSGGEGLQSTALLGVVVDALQSISAHADKLIGRGECRRFSLERIEKGSRSIYKRRKVSGIPGCSHLLIYESSLSGWSLHYSLEDETYLRVVNA